METFETERLILRGWRLEDLEDLYEYAKNREAGIMQGWKPHSDREESLDALNSFIKGGEAWAIVLKDIQKVIGHIKLYPDENRGKYYAKYISYALSSDYWGKGYMTEAVKRIIGYAFEEMKIDLLTAFHYPHNIRSKRVIEKCGFQYEVTVEQGQIIYDGHIFDTVCYSISKEYYFTKIQNIS